VIFVATPTWAVLGALTVVKVPVWPMFVEAVAAVPEAEICTPPVDVGVQFTASEPPAPPGMKFSVWPAVPLL